ncbi:MAG: putative DNA binding domain-containing protein [Chlamydiae bacterium]|nr:putative DNA binding domain-containing protein [Chlamydiota bacterium]
MLTETQELEPDWPEENGGMQKFACRVFLKVKMAKILRRIPRPIANSGFKERYTSKMDRDIVAFSNTKGGYIFLGVDDKGTVRGERLTNRMKAEITDLARKCAPPITIKRMSQIGKVAVIEIEEGFEKPYSCGEGYFRRLDAVTQKMNRKEIEILFKQAFKVSFEDQIHPGVSWKEVDEFKIRHFFEEANIEVRLIEPRPILTSLNLSDSKQIKNAGVLFFAKDPRHYLAQCETICAAFKGTNRVDIYDRNNIQDDLLTQFNESLQFLKKHLNVRSEIKGAKRKDIYELPIEALREALANALIHRDYSMRGTNIMVEVHQDRVMIRNPGGLPEGLTLHSLTHISLRRNELIADLFARMDIVERMGTGIQRIHDLMKKAGLRAPKIESNAFFTITFERPPYTLNNPEKGVEKGVEKLTSAEKMILSFIKKNPHISKKEILLKGKLSKKTIDLSIKKLKEKGRLSRIGPDRGGYWQA